MTGFPARAPGLSAWLELALLAEVPGRDPAVMGRDPAVMGLADHRVLRSGQNTAGARAARPAGAGQCHEGHQTAWNSAGGSGQCTAPCPSGPVWAGGNMARTAEHGARAKMLPVSSQPRAADASASSPGAPRPAGMAPHTHTIRAGQPHQRSSQRVLMAKSAGRGLSGIEEHMRDRLEPASEPPVDIVGDVLGLVGADLVTERHLGGHDEMVGPEVHGT
jgi:hypothetical protein